MHEAFQCLKQIEKRCLESAQRMPSVDSHKNDWVAIGFRLAGTDLLSNMDEVTEILNIPPYTKVPGVKPWMIGIANVRGALLPLIDVKGFVTGVARDNRDAGRVMVVNYKGVHAGLIVEEVQGMRHFSLTEQTYELPEINNSLKPYIKQAFYKNNEYWPVFSLHALVGDERFLHASL